MKRISLILFALVICMVANAQITNKIWNLTLGISGKQQVINAINPHNLQIRDKGVDYINCSSSTSFDFGGESWDYARFRFYNGKLYSISFRYTTFFSVRESFDRLKNSLNKKYYSYIRDKDLSTLLSMPNVVITSHQAFFTKEALNKIASDTCQNIKDIFETGICANEIKKQ